MITSLFNIMILRIMIVMMMIMIARRLITSIERAMVW